MLKQTRRTEDCNHLDLESETCKLLQMECFTIKKQGKQKCGLSFHYYWLNLPSPEKTEAESIRREVEREVIESWKEFVKREAPTGQKNMTGGLLEKAIRKVIRRVLEPLGVSVTDKGKKLSFGDDKSIAITADCIAEKNGHPTSILSIKTGLTPEAIRETFAYAYLSKQWYGQIGYRVFIVALGSDSNLKVLGDTFKPYLDGVYYLSREPYIDDLLEELRKIYV